MTAPKPAASFPSRHPYVIVAAIILLIGVIGGMIQGHHSHGETFDQRSSICAAEVAQDYPNGPSDFVSVAHEMASIPDCKGLTTP